jgi:hypothetical protein
MLWLWSGNVSDPGYRWNLFSRCCANIFAFSKLLRAHFPSGFLIDGTWAIGLFKYFIPFQSEYPVPVLLHAVSSVRNWLIDVCLMFLISLDNCWLPLLRWVLSCGFLDWCHFLLSLRFSVIRSLISFGKLRPFSFLLIVGVLSQAAS